MSTESELQQSIEAYIEKISEGHRLHRKIRFLLDIRGLLVINKIKGDYVEFGVYRCEMMYAAAQILSPHIQRFIGLDTFEGLPEPAPGDEEAFVFESQGFMAATRQMTAAMMGRYNTVLIEGDFRKISVLERFRAESPKIAVLCLDCNWPSSVQAAMAASAPYLQSGSIIFFDDFFVGTRKPNFNERILKEVGDKEKLRFKEFMTYPPCARAFLAEGEASGGR